MVEAKEGKIDKEYFMNMIQQKEVTETKYGPSGMSEWEEKVDYLSGWFLSFFAYYGEISRGSKIKRFMENMIKVKNFKKLANQMLIVPFKIIDDVHKKEYLMKYKVGFVGCDQNNEKEVYPIQGWLVSPSTKDERDSIL